MALIERLRELFADAGLTSTDAVRASHLLFGYVFSSVALDIADLNQPGSPSTAEPIVQLAAAASRSLPAVASHAIGFAEPGPGSHSQGFGACERDGQD